MDSSLGTDSQDSDDLVPPGLTPSEYDKFKISMPKRNLVMTPTSSPRSSKSLGIQNAKKKLRAFSIQKKTTITAVSVPKPVNTGSATVLIGKLSSVKTTPKPDKEVDAEKKPPKPPKPGSSRRNLQASYTALQKRTLCEIEDMKRKMELVELGIPLGLICPSSTSETAMPTKAMPPIKSFLDPSKVDELIREAKKAKAAGKEFKFDYQKLLPDYDNPFQRKKDDMVANEKEKKEEEYYPTPRSDRKDDFERSERRKSDKRYDKKYSDYDRHDKMDDREKDKHREEADKYRSKEKEKFKSDEPRRSRKETDVNLSEYLVCDSWSLDNEDRIASSPKVEKAIKPQDKDKPKEPIDILRENLKKKDNKSSDSPVNKPKMQKLKPVIDAFKFDIDPNEEDDALDLFDEECSMEKFPKPQSKKDSVYDSPMDLKLFDYDQDMSKDIIDANDDNFLESVINEIKQENMSDDTSQDNRTGLVEYDSPKDDDDDEFKMDASQGSVTPELDDRMRDLQSSQQSHYSDGYRSTESGYKSTESYKSDYKPKESRHRADSRQTDSFRSSVEKELDITLERKMSRSTVDSLETWSFVLKICQPLLFRHDKNKCYKETHTSPKLWYTTNPKSCDCVKDRSVVYEELEMCKMSLVDRVYGCDQIPDAACPSSRLWYPRVGLLDVPSSHLSTDWETDEPPRSTTPLQLDREYQRFIESVWPDVSEPKSETTRSTTPDKSFRQESRKKKKAEDLEKAADDKKKAKKMKLSSEGWSQESDLEDYVEKTKKIKTEKERIRKRKHSTSSSESDSEENSKKKKKIKKKGLKKSKVKLAKKRRVSKKIKKKLKEKQKKKRKIEKITVDSDKEDKDKKKEKKLKKKTLMKAKKTPKKKKAKPVSSSSSSSSSSSTDSELEERKKIKKKELLLKKKKKDKKKKRKSISSDSTQSEDLFDVNILNNIKTERLTDDEKNQQMNDFSPRRQKYTTKEREIINVKELQNDFVGNNIHIKQEKEDILKESATIEEQSVEKPEVETLSEQKSTDVSESVDNKPKDVAYKKISVSPEPLSPEIPFTEESQIPLPDEAKNAHPNNASQIQGQTIHLTADSNIPLPAELKTQNIPEPPPQIILEKVVETPCVDVQPLQIIQERVIQTSCVEVQPTPQIIQEKNETPCIEVIPPVPENAEQSPCVEVQPQIVSYSYTDVSASQNELYGSDDKFVDSYEQENYEMYEQMAMAYQSDVANQVTSTEHSGQARPIETVVRLRGEIKCDWRAADNPAPATAPAAASAPATRPSRWGLKPGEVNIVLTGGPSTEPATPTAAVEQYSVVYQIQSLANRHDTSNSSIGYDEAYQVTYGASDRLQYGDCFGEPPPAIAGDSTEDGQGTKQAPSISTLDERINRVLQETALGDAAKDTEDSGADRDLPEKGILVTKSLGPSDPRTGKRVSFADGYKPGQDSDTEEPPVKRKKKSRRYGCAWPCPATHPDHVPLWDALPPPPPPRSPPPPQAAAPPPLHLLRPPPPRRATQRHAKPDGAMSLPTFMPPEPPPGMISFQ